MATWAVGLSGPKVQGTNSALCSLLGSWDSEKVIR